MGPYRCLLPWLCPLRIELILDCKWYDALKAECLNGKDEADALLPGPDGTLCECRVSSDLFLEMLDFCREG